MVRRNASISSIAVLLAAGAFSTASLLSLSRHAQAQNPFDAMRRTIEGLQQRPAQQAPQTQPAAPPPQTQPKPTTSAQPAPMLPEQAAFARLPQSQMADVQEALRQLGFYSGVVDGSYGPGTSQAVSAWQRSRGFPQTGWLTEPQRSLLLTSRNTTATTTPQGPPASSVSTNGFRWTVENLPSNADQAVHAEIKNEKQDILSIECRSSGKFSSKPSLSMTIFHNNFPIADVHTYVFRIGNETHEFKFSQSLFTAETPSDKDALRALIETLIKTDATSFSSQFDNVTLSFSTAGARDALVANDNSNLKTGKTLADCEDEAFKSSNASVTPAPQTLAEAIEHENIPTDPLPTVRQMIQPCRDEAMSFHGGKIRNEELAQQCINTFSQIVVDNPKTVCIGGRKLFDVIEDYLKAVFEVSKKIPKKNFDAILDGDFYQSLTVWLPRTYPCKH